MYELQDQLEFGADYGSLMKEFQILVSYIQTFQANSHALKDVLFFMFYVYVMYFQIYDTSKHPQLQTTFNVNTHVVTLGLVETFECNHM